MSSTKNKADKLRKRVHENLYVLKNSSDPGCSKLAAVYESDQNVSQIDFLNETLRFIDKEKVKQHITVEIYSDLDSDDDDRSDHQQNNNIVKQEIINSDQYNDDLNKRAVAIDVGNSRPATSTVNDLLHLNMSNRQRGLMVGGSSAIGAADINDPPSSTIEKLVSTSSPYDDISSNDEESLSNASTVDYEGRNWDETNVENKNSQSKRNISATPSTTSPPPGLSIPLNTTKIRISRDTSANYSLSNFSPSYGSEPSSTPFDCTKAKRPILKSNFSNINSSKDTTQCQPTSNLSSPNGTGEAFALNWRKSIDKLSNTPSAHPPKNTPTSRHFANKCSSHIASEELLWDPSRNAQPLGGSAKTAKGANKHASSQLASKHVTGRKNATPLIGHGVFSGPPKCSTSSNGKTKVSEAMASKSSNHSADVAQSKSKLHDVSKSNRATDDAKKENHSNRPSTSKGHSSTSNHSSEIGLFSAIRKHARAINRGLSEPDAWRITRNFIEQIKKFPKQNTSAEKEANKIAKEVKKRKRHRDPNRESAVSTQKSMGNANETDIKRRKTSTIPSFVNDSMEWYDDDDSNEYFASDSVIADDNDLLKPIYFERKRVDKNVDPSICFEYKQFKTLCVACDARTSDKTVTYHYVQKHREVYTSRLSAEYARKAKEEPVSPRFEGPTTKAMLRSVCYFCAAEKTFTVQYWRSHLISHTGEYPMECETCKHRSTYSSNSHPQRCTNYKPRELFAYSHKDGYFSAFMCEDCNYVQLQAEKMESHLRNEHGYSGDLSVYYTSIKLVATGKFEPKPEVKSERLEMHVEDFAGSYPTIDEVASTLQRESPSRPTPDQILRNIKSEHQPSSNGYVDISYAAMNQVEERLSNSICEQLARELEPDEPQDFDEMPTVNSRPIKMEMNEASRMGNEQLSNSTVLRREENSRVRYLSLRNFYIGENRNLVVNLKPWSNTNDAPVMGVEKQLRPITLYALFKCMAEGCIYSTNKAANMLQHMTDHSKLVNCLTEDGDTLKPRQKEGWLDCAYCNYVADTSQMILEHTQREHGSSRFQCSHCFYRTIEIKNFDLHIAKYHPDEDVTILICNLRPDQQPASAQEAHDKMIESRRKYVLPYVCNEGGKRQFYLKEHFQAHLESLNSNFYKCTYSMCPINVPAANALKHMECHGFYTYQCIYCENGASTIRELQRHMSEEHPSKLLYLAARTLCDRTLRRAKQGYVATLIVDVGSKNLTPHKIAWCPYTENEINFMQPQLNKVMSWPASNDSWPAYQAIDSYLNKDLDDILKPYRLARSYDDFRTSDEFQVESDGRKVVTQCQTFEYTNSRM